MRLTTPLRRTALYGLVAIALVAGLTRTTMAAPQTSQTPPKPAVHREVATFAAGCFWSMEAIFKQLKGVIKVEPGYAGGRLANPSYEQVETGNTGHAESLNIVFNPEQISYRNLLQVLLTVRNPTTRNQQGPDEGPQYRSVIFFRSPQQERTARRAIEEVTAAHLWPNPIVTEVTRFTNFYRAEDYHLDYYRHHPDEPYCHNVIAPEIEEFREKFRSWLKQ